MVGIAAIIFRARELVRAGWVQGRLRCDSGYCIVGALVAATDDVKARWLAVDFVRKACGTALVVTWNDSPGRTKHEVMAILERAAHHAASEARREAA